MDWKCIFQAYSLSRQLFSLITLDLDRTSLLQAFAGTDTFASNNPIADLHASLSSILLKYAATFFRVSDNTYGAGCIAINLTNP